MNIKILGAGCRNCNRLEANIKRAVAELGLEASVEKITHMKEIVAHGVMRTPALVVDNEVKVVGKVLTVEEIKRFLSEANN